MLKFSFLERVLRSNEKMYVGTASRTQQSWKYVSVEKAMRWTGENEQLQIAEQGCYGE